MNAQFEAELAQAKALNFAFRKIEDIFFPNSNEELWDLAEEERGE